MCTRPRDAPQATAVRRHVDATRLDDDEAVDDDDALRRDKLRPACLISTGREINYVFTPPRRAAPRGADIKGGNGGALAR